VAQVTIKINFKASQVKVNK